MEKAKYSAFDLFGYALPGIYSLLACYILFHPQIQQLTDILDIVGQFNLNHAILLLLIGYIVGFTFYRLGASLRRVVGQRLWKDRKEYPLELTETEKLVLVREHCQENFKYIQTWFLISGMSANLALGSLILTLASIIKIVQFGSDQGILIQWIGLGVIAMFMVYYQIEKSYVYAKWARRELNQAILTFKLGS